MLRARTSSFLFGSLKDSRHPVTPGHRCVRPSASARCFFHLPVDVSALGRHGGAGSRRPTARRFGSRLQPFCAEFAWSPCMPGFSLDTQKTNPNSYILDWMEGETLCSSVAGERASLLRLSLPSPDPQMWLEDLTWQRWINNSMYCTARSRPLLVNVWVNGSIAVSSYISAYSHSIKCYFSFFLLETGWLC